VGRGRQRFDPLQETFDADWAAYREKGETMKHVKDLLPGTDRALAARLASLEKAWQQRQERKPKEQAEKPKTAEIVQLPLWSEPARGVPNSALRGALFSAIQGKDRRYMKGELLAVQQGMQIRFTGMQLDQSDLDVWEQALHLARQHPLGTRCDFTAHGFLKALGRRTGKSDHEWLKDVFRRLTACAVEITVAGKTYFGPLIEGGARDENTGRYVVEINPKIKDLYTAGWTATDWAQRQALRGKPLALWLHGFYSTHAKPHPLKVETLMELCGSRTKEAFHYKANLKKNLALLQAVGAIRDFEISDGLVYVDSVPSGSQRKYLIRAKPRKK
jgi:hypothetical protein